MSTTHQSAPPAEAPKGDFVKFEPFPKNDTLVLTVVAYNYIPKYDFERTDDNGVKSIQTRPALEFYFGTIIGGKSYFVKPWPTAYSLHEKANYAKWYEAATGKVPEPGTTPDAMLGKHVLGTIKVEDKVGAKGTKYRISKLAGVTGVPEVLASTGTPLDKLKPALEAALAGDDKKEANPF